MLFPPAAECAGARRLCGGTPAAHQLRCHPRRTAL